MEILGIYDFYQFGYGFIVGLATCFLLLFIVAIIKEYQAGNLDLPFGKKPSRQTKRRHAKKEKKK